jgi:hypothetical protein
VAARALREDHGVRTLGARLGRALLATGRPGPRVLIGVLLPWLAVVVATSLSHEVWRDEMRAYSLATEPASLLDLPEALRNEGHPLLWYVLVRLLAPLCGGAPVIKVLAAAAGLLGAWLLLARAPFPLGLRILALFGVFPLYEYAVIARSYALAPPLFFAFAAAWPGRRGRPLLPALALAGLAHVSAYSAILAILLAALWAWDDLVVHRAGLPRRARRRIAAALALVAGAGVLAAASFVPGPETSTTSLFDYTAGDLPRLAGAAVAWVPWRLAACFPGAPAAGAAILLAGLAAGLLGRPSRAVVLLLGAVAVSAASTAVYYAQARQQGMFFVFALAVLWIAAGERGAGAAGGRAVSALRRVAAAGVLPLLLLLHLAAGARAVAVDLRGPYASSRALAGFLTSREEYRRAVLLAEPDFVLESLPYYADHPTFLAREGRYARHVRFEKAFRGEMTLTRLLDAAAGLRAAGDAPVLLLLGPPPFPPAAAGRVDDPIGGSLAWTEEEVARLRRETRLVARFTGSLLKEDYDVLEYLGPR